MRVHEGTPRRDYEEILRSVGARLDAANLRDFVIVELEDGFFVRGTSARDDWDALERMQTLSFLDSEIEAVLEEAYARRGSHRPAGRIEAAFRLIGRYIDDNGGSEILIVERGEFVLLRLAVRGEGFRFLEVGPDNLSAWANLARQARPD